MLEAQTTEDQNTEDMTQEANTIILEFGSYDKDDIRDLRKGKGKIFKRVGRVIESMREEGELSKHVQPVIVVVKQKRKGVLD